MKLSIVNIEDVENEAMKLTEVVLNKTTDVYFISKSNHMEIRKHAFPKLLKYLLDDNYSYTTSSKVIALLLDKNDNQGKNAIEIDYAFSQKDMNDNFGKYMETEEFKAIANSLEYGTRWSMGNVYQADKDEKLAANVLFTYTAMISQNKKISHIPLAKVTNEGSHIIKNMNDKNNEILLYHANRLVEILKRQPGSYITKNSVTLDKNIKETKKMSDDVNNETSKNAENEEQYKKETQKTLLNCYSYIDDLIENAYQYRKIIDSSFKNIEVNEISLISSENIKNKKDLTLKKDSVEIKEKSKQSI